MFSGRIGKQRGGKGREGGLGSWGVEPAGWRPMGVVSGWGSTYSSGLFPQKKTKQGIDIWVGIIHRHDWVGVTPDAINIAYKMNPKGEPKGGWAHIWVRWGKMGMSRQARHRARKCALITELGEWCLVRSIASTC